MQTILEGLFLLVLRFTIFALHRCRWYEILGMTRIEFAWLKSQWRF